MRRQRGRIDGCAVLMLVVIAGVLTLFLSNLLSSNAPDTSEEFAAEHEEKLSTAAVEVGSKLDKARITELLLQARSQGGVVDLDDGHALVRFKIGAQFKSADEAFTALDESMKAWAQDKAREITKIQKIGGHT